MKYLKRILRWLKCRHRWETWSMEDLLNPIGSCAGIMVYEPLDHNRGTVKFCSKCGEVRTIGKRMNTLWI